VKLTYKNLQSGMTLIEVMVGFVLTSILLFGLTGLWSVVNKQFQDLTIKQKAVFVLSGEMERLAAVYTWDKKFIEDKEVAGLPGTIIYNKEGRFVTADNGSDFKTSQVGDLLYFGGAAFAASDRNVVWIDQDHSVTGLLSWSVENVHNPAENKCFSGQECKLLTLFLNYPYRYKTDAAPINSTMGKVYELSLQTIVGRRE